MLIFESQDPVTLVGAAPSPKSLIEAAFARSAHVVAADGGADHLARLDMRPDRIIGDLDSIANVETWRESGLPVHRIEDQETTDFEKCLAAIAAPLILGVGFLGGRVDHGLAALSALMANRERAVVLLGPHDVCFHCPGSMDLEVEPGTRVSLYPLAGITGTHSEGLEWSVEGLTLTPGDRVGTSNRAVARRVRVGFDGPGCLVLLPPDRIDAAIRAVTRAVNIPAR